MSAQDHSKVAIRRSCLAMSTLGAARAPGIEGVPPSNEGKMPSIPALPANADS